MARNGTKTYKKVIRRETMHFPRRESLVILPDGMNREIFAARGTATVGVIHLPRSAVALYLGRFPWGRIAGPFV